MNVAGLVNPKILSLWKRTLVSSADGERGDIDGLSFALYCIYVPMCIYLYVHSNLTTGAV